ncbi:MAG: 1-(5-phosphoribosyl)-5-[(5-phosphoribosylamino)methylideneamino] imidazole-4-carboxamide isomerase [Acidobacteriia bacterium]|nr:1-(5-phosphoribosyl)-5-[(5-phosphoribosylamino)methylideneamino] imidazole-4-carboxamide isomerase [Terriglobia bacterium]
MLIPSIDLMGGKIVQLVQGERKALEFSDFDAWIERFAGYPMVQLIDLDAAIGTGSNRDLLTRFTSRLPCQVGGGIRSVEAAQEALAAGARKIIVGSALVRGNDVNTAFAAELAQAVGADRVIAALDSRGGKVAVHGWRELAAMTPVTMLREVEPYCGGFLYTHIETEGLMQGIPLDVVRELRRATSRQLIVAGGICSQEEVDVLDAMRVDAVVGMAIYTGRMKA